MGTGYDSGSATGDRTADMQIAQQGPAEQDLRKWQNAKRWPLLLKIGELRFEMRRRLREALRETDPDRKAEIFKEIDRQLEEIDRLEKEIQKLDEAQTV